MLSSIRMNRWVKSSYRWLIVVLLLGIIGAVVSYADDPVHNVTIEPRLNSGSRVWGLGETVYFWAYCEPCDEDCETEFTNDKGLTNHSYLTGAVFINGTPASTGSYSPLVAACPSGETPATSDFKVVDIASVEVNGTPVASGSTLYFSKAASGDVTIEAFLTPSATYGELHSGFMNWSGGTAVNELKRTVSKTIADSTTVTCKPDGSGTTSWSVTIVVVDIVPSAQLWYFNGSSPGNYQTTIYLTADGLSSSGTFAWTVTAGTSYVDFLAGGDSYTAYNTNQVYVVSTDASLDPNDVTVQLTYNGTVVDTCVFTVYAPQHRILTPGIIPNPADGTYSTDGFKSDYWIRVVDMFQGVMPATLPVNESFSTWTSDYPNENWPSPTACSWNTNATGDFRDTYAYSNANANPRTIWKPLTGWNTVKIDHCTQYYKAGTPNIGNGRIFSTHTLQFYQGSGRQE